jgi:hypothetical protein
MKIEHLFQFFCNEVDSIWTMMDEAMVSRHTSPLLPQAIIFTTQNVGIPFQNCFIKLCNSTQNKASKLTYNQTNVA